MKEIILKIIVLKNVHKKNIDIINEVMQFTIGYCGSFGTGYPFYALDKNFEGELPVIQEQLRYNEELKNTILKSKLKNGLAKVAYQ